jgi:hypothetical protein
MSLFRVQHDAWVYLRWLVELISKTPRLSPRTRFGVCDELKYICWTPASWDPGKQDKLGVT